MRNVTRRASETTTPRVLWIHEKERDGNKRGLGHIQQKIFFFLIRTMGICNQNKWGVGFGGNPGFPGYSAVNPRLPVQIERVQTASIIYNSHFLFDSLSLFCML